jgi:hypothetical protein
MLQSEKNEALTDNVFQILKKFSPPIFLRQDGDMSMSGFVNMILASSRMAFRSLIGVSPSNVSTSTSQALVRSLTTLSSFFSDLGLRPSSEDVHGSQMGSSRAHRGRGADILEICLSSSKWRQQHSDQP